MALRSTWNFAGAGSTAEPSSFAASGILWFSILLGTKRPFRSEMPLHAEKDGSPLYVEFRGRRFHSRAILFGGQWHHVVLNFSGEQTALLLDGKPVSMDAVGPVPARAPGPMAIGDPHNEKPL